MNGPLRTALLLACLGTAAPALSQDGPATEEMRDKIQETVALVPGAGNRQVSVNIVDGRYVVTGFADSIDYRQDTRDAVAGIEGLNLDLVDVQITVQ